MPTNDKLNIELDSETMSELKFSLATLANRIRWTLENTTVRDPVALKHRLDMIEQAVKSINEALEKRAPKAKPATVLKSVK